MPFIPVERLEEADSGVGLRGRLTGDCYSRGWSGRFAYFACAQHLCRALESRDVRRHLRGAVEKLPSFLFYVVAAWCIGIGLFNQTVDQVVDFPWVAASLEGMDLARFDPVLATWARWIGLNLIAAGVALILLAKNLGTSPSVVWAAGVLSVGVVGAQVVSAASLGAPLPLLLVPAVALVCALTAVGISLKSSRRDDA